MLLDRGRTPRRRTRWPTKTRFTRRRWRCTRPDAPGKYEIKPTKPLETARDLALAYTPGVAAPCLAIKDDPERIYELTNKGDLVAVISNGTAVLGLGNIGAKAAKPVMEGKAVLFKRFADIDGVDICVDAPDPETFINSVRYLGPSFGGINLEDIRGPECFEIEERLRALMDIPVFHDDQHGTAVVVGAALLNALHLTGRDIGTIKLVSTGGGAAGIACLDFLVSLGLRRGNVRLFDIEGLIRPDRPGLHPRKAVYGQSSGPDTLETAIRGADVFLGLSAPGLLKPEMVEVMAARPIILALANPTPEILPDVARAVPSRRDHRHRPLRLPPIRSTTCWASRSSSAARSTPAPASSTRR